MTSFDPKVLREIDQFGAETGQLAKQLGELIRTVETRLSRIPTKVEAAAVHWPTDTPPIKLTYQRIPKGSTWAIYVSAAITWETAKMTSSFSNETAVPLTDANLTLKIAAAGAIPGLLDAIRDAQRQMAGKLSPAVAALSHMVKLLETKGGE